MRILAFSGLNCDIAGCEEIAAAGQAHKLNGAIQNSQLHVLKDCGHLAVMDRPEQVSAVLIDFLATRPKPHTPACN